MKKDTQYYSKAGFRCLNNIKRQTNDLYLVHCGYQKCPPGHTYNHKVPNEYHLHFIISGHGHLTVNGTDYQLGKDDIFIIPKGVRIYYSADITNPWEYAWVVFDGSMAANYVEYLGLSTKKPYIQSTVPTETYLRLIKKILDANELTLSNEIRRVSYLLEILATVIESQAKASNAKGCYDYSSETYVEHAIQFISLHYNNIKVNDIADFIGINRSYLTTIFKKELNMSPQEYLISYRLGIAAKCLISSNRPIKDIAAQIGYDNPLNFSKCFKKVYDMSPSKYRESIDRSNE